MTGTGNIGRVMMVAWVALLGVGCTHAAQIEGRIDALRAELQQAEQNGAERCAPRELALAQAHVRFAALELEQGDPPRAEEHLTLARPNVSAALTLSPADACVDWPDADGDGIPDPQDACPEEPEDLDGYEDEDGCPEDQDTDGDGVGDGEDLCLAEPEDADGYLDEDGCPDEDNDADGILDVDDRCPMRAEDPDGFADKDGCPDEDNDADGILDVDDRCPNEPGPESEGGCPKAYEGVEVTTTHIRITQRVYFRTGKAVLLARSHGLLNTVARVLEDYPSIRVEVQGHTDDRGSDRYNLGLSEARAKAVRSYLGKRGVSPSRMTAKGYGEMRPIDTNTTETGRANNRRVEFVRTDPGAVSPD